MTWRFSHLPIRWKMALVSMLASVVVLVVACGAFFQLGVVRARADLVRTLWLRAEIVGNVSAASLLFDDSKTGFEILDALRIDRRITAAALYRQDREMFVSYQTEAGTDFAEAEKLFPHGERFVGERLVVMHAIYFQGDHVGYIALASDLTYLHDAVRRSIAVAVWVLAFCGALAALLSSQLQRLISEPILALTEFARTIARRRDYTLRIPVHRSDEVGLLAAGFNDMLAQIEQRDTELQSARDMLERRVEERTEALRRQAEELTRSNADLEQFAYVASHDLQEPLRMVASYTQLLAETSKDKLDRDARQFIDYAVDGALRMQRLISDLLAYSRLGRGEIRMTEVDLQDVVAQATKNLEVAVAESGARVGCDPLPVVHGNATLLTQLLQNLIGNAVKFRGDRPPEVHVGVRQHDGAYELSGRDHGIGFDPKYAPKVFVIFQRLHARGKYPGTGIGLAVCKKIVEHHGGRIWVESAPGEGTTFFFTIPDHATETATPTKEEQHERTIA